MPLNNQLTLDELVEWQRERAFKGLYERLDLAEYARNFKANPNEAYHIFDCQRQTIEMEENTFDQVFEMPGFKPEGIMEILNLIHQDHKLEVFNFMAATLANETLFELGKDSVCQVFMIENQQMIMKTSTPLITDSNNHVIYVLEQYRNVTGLVKQGYYSWSYKGPNQDEITRVVKKVLAADCPLTTQELSILSFIGLGLSSQETADRLFLSKHTIDTHRRNILKKLKVKNTVRAYDQAREMGILV